MEASDPSASRRNSFIVSGDTGISVYILDAGPVRVGAGDMGVKKKQGHTPSVIFYPLACLSLPTHLQTAVAGVGKLESQYICFQRENFLLLSLTP